MRADAHKCQTRSPVRVVTLSLSLSHHVVCIRGHDIAFIHRLLVTEKPNNDSRTEEKKSSKNNRILVALKIQTKIKQVCQVYTL